ncbi:hypothetical protein CPB85DRAFT_1431546 [Mucidula mucida]|nr:hypothetical protein CPB85DRAFT_1431546 [Mucidula mucida]
MLFVALFSFSLFLSAASRSDLRARAISNPDPAVGGSTSEGWQALPDIPDATKSDWVVDSTIGAKLPVFQSSGRDPAAVKRAIIILPGNPRDCWYYWNVVNNALYVANEQDPSGVKLEEVSIMAPCFFNEADRAAGALQSDQLSWGNLNWVTGEYNVGPESISKYSSFSVVDSLVDYYMDQATFPSLNVVVIGGHSAGAQMVQRYIGLRSSILHDERLHFWVANPASFMWLTESHPIATSEGCENVDEYKYGLSGGFPGYSGWYRFEISCASNSLCLGFGQYFMIMDDLPGDTSCEAQTQGSNHLDRGRNFVAMLEGMDGGVPTNTTVDYIDGVAHDNVLMMQSAMGIDKLFRYNYNVSWPIALTDTSTSESAAATPSGSSSSSASGSHSGAGSSSGSHSPNSAANLHAPILASCLIVLSGTMGLMNGQSW